MTNNISYFTLFSAEVFKMKRNVAVIIMLLTPLIFTMLFSMYFALKNEMFASYGNNIWLIYINYHFAIYSLFYPIMVAFFTYSYINIEYENNCFKQLFTLPVSRKKLFFSKILTILSVVILSVLIAYVLFILSGNILGILFPDMGFQDFNSRVIIDVLFIRTAIILLSISMIQFTLSLLYPNFVFSISLALFFTVLSLILSKYEYIPYTFIQKSSNMATNIGNQTIFDKTIYISIIYIVVFIIVGLFVFRRDKFKTI